MLTWKNWPLLKITTKAEGCTESRSSCHRCITIYCIKALVQGLKGIAFHSNSEIILCTINPLLSPPSQISPLPLISPPFSGKERVSYRNPPPPVKQVEMEKVACLYHCEKGPGVIAVLLPFGWDASSLILLIFLLICHVSLFIFWVECRSEGL